MKITFVLPHAGLAGGIRVVAIYAEKLWRKGHEVCVVSIPQKPLSLKSRFKSLIKGNGWSDRARLEPVHFDNLDVPHKIIESVRPITDADLPNADVVIATWWETAEWVANLADKKGAKVYFVQHHEIHDYLPQERVKKTYTLPLHKIAIARWLVDLMATEYGDSNVSLVPNSVDLTQFYAIGRNKQDVPTVGMMYSSKLWKGCDISLRAFALAGEKLPNLRLVVFGKEKPSPDLPLPREVEYIFQPSQATIKDIYARCDAWLFASRTEGFGLPILEAMACRTPVIGTPAGAAPELLQAGGGILVKSEDPEDMAKAIVRVGNLSQSEWSLMSEKAHNTAISYTWDDAVNLFESALNDAINSSRKMVRI